MPSGPPYSRKQVVAACIRELRSGEELTPENRETIAGVIEQLSRELDRAPAQFQPANCPKWQAVRKRWFSNNPPDNSDVLTALSSSEPVPAEAAEIAAWLLEHYRDGRILSPLQRQKRAFRHDLAKLVVGWRSAELKAKGVRKHRDEAFRQIAEEIGGDHPRATEEELRQLVSRGLPKSYSRK